MFVYHGMIHGPMKMSRGMIHFYNADQRLICPTGKSLPRGKNLSSPRVKNISLFPKPKSVVVFAPSRSSRGAFRERHGRGAGCGGRNGDARRAALMRTAKACGPGAPTLAL